MSLGVSVTTSLEQKNCQTETYEGLIFSVQRTKARWISWLAIWVLQVWHFNPLGVKQEVQDPRNPCIKASRQSQPEAKLGKIGKCHTKPQLSEVKFSRFLHPSRSAFSEATCAARPSRWTVLFQTAVLQAPQASGKRFLVRRGHSLKQCESNGFIVECLSSSKHLYVEFSWP